jgi:hypothetical protein
MGSIAIQVEQDDDTDWISNDAGGVVYRQERSAAVSADRQAAGK